MTALLAKAIEHIESDRPRSSSRACWLARAVLERVIADLLAARDVDAHRASERARLSCLEGLYADRRDVVHRAEYAWSRLSDACHEHAYQLAPSLAEVRHLVGLVRELADVAVSLSQPREVREPPA